MAFFQTLKTDFSSALTPITNRLREQFGIGAPAPSSTPLSTGLSTVLGTTKTITPIADGLREKFGIPAEPTPEDTGSVIDRFAAGARDRFAAATDTFRKKNPFLSNVYDIGAGATERAAAAGEAALGTQLQNMKDFATGRLTLEPGDVLSGLEKTGLGTAKLTGMLAQGIIGGLARIGASMEAAVLPGGQSEIDAGNADPMQRKVTQFLTGSPEIETYQKLYNGADTWAQSKGATQDGAKTFAGFAVLGTLFMDSPVGPGGLGKAGKVGFTLSKDGIEQIAKEATDDGIKSILKTENPNLSDKAIDFMTPLFRDATTPEDVARITKFVKGSEKTATAALERKQIIEDAKVGSNTDHPAVQSLIDSARKYSSADDFEANVLRPADLGGDLSNVDRRITTKKLSTLSPAEDLAKFEEPNVENLIAAVKNGETLPPVTIKDNLVIDGANRLEAYKRLGYDRVPVLEVTNPGSGRVVNAADFHAAAAGSEAKGSEPFYAGNYRTAPVDTNLVKKLGELKSPYEILNVLKHEFPNMPDRVIDRMVERFARTKRVANIEGLLRAGRNLDAKFSGGEIIAQSTEESAAKEMLDAAGKKIPAESVAALEKTVPDPIKKLMRQDQKEAYIKAIKTKFEDPKEAVAAEQEYQRIWDDLNQKVVDTYDELSMQKSVLEDTLSADPAEQLYKRYLKGSKDPGRTLDEYMTSVQKKYADRTKRAGKMSKREQNALQLDSEITDLGYKDFEEAQAAVERYMRMRDEVKNLGEQLKALSPRVKEARILQEGLDDIAIIPREDVLAIDKLITRTNMRDEFDDISGFAGQARDIYRNFEKFFGKLYPDVKKAILDPFDSAKGRFVDTNKMLADDLETNIVKRFGITRGSRESAAIMRYGDTDLPGGERRSFDELVKEFGQQKAENIRAADAYFRSTYDRLIDELNAVRKKIYPNTPGKLIAKRANYYRHYSDLAETWGDALREFFDTPSGIDPNLVGLSEFTKAKTRFLPFAEARKGQGTELDAIGGFLDYVPAFAYAKEIDPTISSFRYLRRKIAEVAPRAGEELTSPLGKTFKAKGAEAMLGFLDDFARDLTGNTNPMDRWIQRIVGRKNIRAARFFNNRMKANTVGGNLGSAVAQLANVPAGIADTKLYAAKGLQRSLGSLLAENEPMKNSIFLKERYAESLHDRFPIKFADRPVKATSDEVKKVAGWVMRKGDEIGTKFIWNSEYEKALGKGIEDPVKFADDRTRKIVAGRGIGEVPLGQKALTTQFIAPFTLEVGNAWWIMRGWVKEKDMAALATFFLANYILNDIAENVRGSRVTFDPINATIEGAQELTQEWKEGNYARGGIKMLGREAGEVISNIPFGQTAAAIIPDEGIQYLSKAATGAPMDKKQLFGQSQVSGRYGTPLIVSGLQDAVFRVLPPVGGMQLKKTYQGLLSLVRGRAEDSKGNATFDVPRSPVNITKALMFGSGATSEARKYFSDRTDLFNRIDRQSSDAFIRNASAEADWANMKKMIAAGNKKAAGDYLASVAQKDPLAAKAIAGIAADEKMGLSPNDRLVKMLNVQNGERAKYIVEQLKKMKTGDDRANYVADLAQKKLVSKDVIAQISLLLAAK